jgi:hypothetical protein
MALEFKNTIQRNRRVVDLGTSASGAFQRVDPASQTMDERDSTTVSVYNHRPEDA